MFPLRNQPLLQTRLREEEQVRDYDSHHNPPEGDREDGGLGLAPHEVRTCASREYRSDRIMGVARERRLVREGRRPPSRVGCASPMVAVLLALLASLRGAFRSRAALHLEVLGLRHQLAVYQRRGARARTKVPDRLLWAWLSRRWPGWREVLVFVQPSTVVA